MTTWLLAPLPNPVLVTTQNKTVLIVDDESAQRAWMRGILRRQGYAVLEASDYTEALSVKTRDTGSIDLFVIDLRLPGGSGYDLAEELLAAHPASKILFVSGTAGAEICKYFATPLPVVQFLHKPFAAVQLASRVREIFQPAMDPSVATATAGASSPGDDQVLRAAPSLPKRQRKC